MVSDAWGYMETDPDLSVSLAVRATDMARSSTADRGSAVSEQALRFALRESRVRCIMSETHAGGATVAAYNRASAAKMILTAGNDGIARLWKASDENPWEMKPAGHLRVPLDPSADVLPVNAAVFGPFGDRDNTRIALACGDGANPNAPGRAVVWFPGAAEGKQLVELAEGEAARQGPVLAIAWSPDGKLVVTGGADGCVRVWEAQTGKLKATLSDERTAGPVNAVAWHPKRAGLIAVASGDQQSDTNSTMVKFNLPAGGPESPGALLWQWDSPDDSGPATIALTGQQGAATTIAFSPSGGRVASAGADFVVRVWDTGSMPGTLKNAPAPLYLRSHTGAVSSVEFSPDSQLLVSAGRDQIPRVWDPNTGFLVSMLRGHNALVHRASFGGYGLHGAKGQFIVTASFDGTSRVFEARTGVLHASLLGHDDGVNFADFSPDARTVVTAGVDGTARVWEVDLRPASEFRGSDAQLNVAAFSQDRRYVLCAGLDCQAWIWEVSASTTRPAQAAEDSFRPYRAARRRRFQPRRRAGRHRKFRRHCESVGLAARR